MSNEELIASTQHTVLVLRRLVKSEAHAASAAFYEDVALVLEGLAVALEAQSAPLLLDSREALANALGVALANAYDDDSVVTVEECVADTLLASGVVSLAADRDRATAERAWDEGAYFVLHERWVDGDDPPPNPYRESEGK